MRVHVAFALCVLLSGHHAAHCHAQTTPESISTPSSISELSELSEVSEASTPSEPSTPSASEASVSEMSEISEDEDSPPSISSSLDDPDPDDATNDKVVARPNTATATSANAFTSGTAPSLVSVQPKEMFLSENINNDNNGKAYGKVKTKNNKDNKKNKTGGGGGWGKNKGAGGGWKANLLNEYLLMTCPDLTLAYDDLTISAGTSQLRGQNRKKVKGIERSYCLQDCPTELATQEPTATPIFACDTNMYSTENLASRCVKLRRKHDDVQSKMNRINTKPQRIQQKRGVMRRYQRYESQVEGLVGQLDAFCSAVPSS